MKGETVKRILFANGYKLKDIALTMDETPQNLQSMLKTEDIKTGVLERIAKSINKSLTFFLSGEQESKQDCIRCAQLEKEIERLNKQHVEHLELIASLTKKINDFAEDPRSTRHRNTG